MRNHLTTNEIYCLSDETGCGLRDVNLGERRIARIARLSSAIVSLSFSAAIATFVR